MFLLLKAEIINNFQLTLLFFALTIGVAYAAYGERFFDDYLLYHIRRKDLKHNFSVYFYPIYLTHDNPTLSALLGYGAFVPQLALIIFYAIR